MRSRVEGAGHGEPHGAAEGHQGRVAALLTLLSLLVLVLSLVLVLVVVVVVVVVVVFVL